MFRQSQVIQTAAENSQSVIEFFGEHGDALPAEMWRAFHRWYHRMEMTKCITDYYFKEGFTMQYSTKEFARVLGISDRTVEGWRIYRKGNPPVLIPAQRDEKGRAFYTEEQLEIARALLNRNQKTSATSPSLFDNDPPYNKPGEDAETTAETANEEKAPVPVTIDADAQIVPTDVTSPVEPVEEIITAIEEKPLPVLESEIKFHLARGTEHFIEAGRRLIAAKAIVPHGEWNIWLEKFSLKRQAAQNLMGVAGRFGAKYQTCGNLSYSALVALLPLPEGDEQAFIDAQAEAGKPVAEQSAREVQKNVKAWNEQRRPKQKHVEESIGADNQSDNDTQTGTPRNIENLMGVIQPETISTSEDTVSNDDAQIDDETGKLIVGDKPLDSCQSFVCIDEETDKTPQSPADDDDLRKAQAEAQNALAAVSAAIKQLTDRDTLENVTRALNAIAAELDAKKLARNPREQKGQAQDE